MPWQVISSAAIALILVASSSARAQTASQVLMPTWSSGDSYLDEIRKAGLNAAKFLWLAGEPIFVGVGNYAIGGVPSNGHFSVAIIFPTRADNPEYLDKTASFNFCRTITPTAEMEQHTKYVIACDPESIRKLEILIRLTHSLKFADTYMHNDWSFMQGLKRIEVDPIALVREMGPIEADDQHIREHVSLMLAFLYAHEAWHLTHGEGKTFDAADATKSNVDDELSTMEMCRNYDEFARQGIHIWEPDGAIPLKEEGTTKSPSTQAHFAATRRIWQEELDADRYAARNLVSILAAFHSRGMSQLDLEHMFRDVLEDFGNLALLIWHSKLAPFATKQCQSYAGQDYFLTRCMCQDPNRFKVVESLLGASHPPIALRMETAASDFINGVGRQGLIEAKLTAGNPQIQGAMGWSLLLKAMTDTPLKMAMTQCTGLSKKASRLTMVFPDIVGVFGPNGSKAYPGYPADEQQLIHSCEPSLSGKK